MKKSLRFLTGLFSLLMVLIYLHPTIEAATTCGTIGSPVAGGLVSSPNITGQFYTSSGACIIDPKAAFVPYNIPSYDSLKSLYYDQAKVKPLVTKHSPINGSATQDNIQLTPGKDHIYYVSGTLDINSLIGGAQNAIVFVGGDLNIGPLRGNPSATTCVSENYGIVFVVKGNVNIHQSVTGFNGLVIAEGRNGYSICTAYTGTECPATNITTQQLLINGSLIALNDANPIKFRRSLPDNNRPAEDINHQVKYLVILRDLLSDTSLRWGEIDASAAIPPQAPHTSIPLPPAPPSSNNNPGACDITTCHAAYTYTSPGSCIPNDATCAATYPNNTCYSGSVDCTASCTLTPATCFTGFTCSKTGVCPNNYHPATTCPTGGCSSLTGGTQATFYTGTQCDPATNCTITSTQANQCPKDSSGNYTCYEGNDVLYHEANSCNSLVCNHSYPGNTCYIGSSDCPANICFGANSRPCSAGNTCGKNSFCPSNYLTSTPSSCPAGGCSAACSSSGCGSQARYTSSTSCTANNALCTISSNQLTQCPNTNGTYTCFEGADRYYHDANSCGSLTCNHMYPGNTCFAGSSDCTASCTTTPASCYTGNACGKTGTCPTNTPSSTTSSSCNYCGGTTTYNVSGACGTSPCPTNYPTNQCFAGSSECSASCTTSPESCHNGNACGKTGTCPNNYYAATSCPTGGCSSLTGGTQATFYSGTQCDPASSCTITSTQLNQCPNTNGTYTCFEGADRYYHDTNSCRSLTCNQMYPGNTCFTGTADCPKNQCYGPNTKSCYAGNACSKSGFCPSTYYASTASSCTANGGCSSSCTSTGCGSTTQFYNGASCSQTPCAVLSTLSECPAACYVGAIYKHAANTCAATKCNNNYPYDQPNSDKNCVAGGCETSAGSGVASLDGGGVQDQYYPPNSCSKTGCSITSTAPYKCPGGCYDGPNIPYHQATTCATSGCDHHYPTYNGNYCDYCGGFTTYNTGNQCSAVSCPTNYTAATGSVPSCRTSPFWYSSGNQCGYTKYEANCPSGICGGHGCLQQSWVRAALGGDCGNTEWKWIDQWSDGTIVRSSSWYSNSCGSHYETNCDDNYSTNHHAWSNSYLNGQPAAHQNQDGINHILPPQKSGSCSDHGGECNFDWNDATCICVGCAQYSNPEGSPSW